MSIVVPAVLAASRKELEEKLALLARISSVNRVQIDVVDGRLAEPASWPYTDSTGSPQAAQEEFDEMVKKSEMLPYLDRVAYEIDLMCFDVLPAVEAWLALGASRLTFHTESDTNPSQLLASVRRRYGSDFLSLGLALNIESNFTLVRPCLGDIEYVQFMGIAKIGQQGQPFDERVFKKIETFHTMYPDVPLQVDGGVSLANATKLLALGVSNLIVGSALLKAHDPAAEVAKFEALQTSYGV